MPQPRRHADAAAKQRACRQRQAETRRREQEAKGLPPAPAIPTMPSRPRWAALVAQARLMLETARHEMQAYAQYGSDREEGVAALATELAWSSGGEPALNRPQPAPSLPSCRSWRLVSPLSEPYWAYAEARSGTWQRTERAEELAEHVDLLERALDTLETL